MIYGDGTQLPGHGWNCVCNKGMNRNAQFLLSMTTVAATPSNSFTESPVLSGERNAEMSWNFPHDDTHIMNAEEGHINVMIFSSRRVTHLQTICSLAVT